MIRVDSGKQGYSFKNAFLQGDFERELFDQLLTLKVFAKPRVIYARGLMRLVDS
jgi:hypothetical protein